MEVASSMTHSAFSQYTHEYAPTCKSLSGCVRLLRCIPGCDLASKQQKRQLTNQRGRNLRTRGVSELVFTFLEIEIVKTPKFEIRKSNQVQSWQSPPKATAYTIIWRGFYKPPKMIWILYEMAGRGVLKAKPTLF